MRKLSLIAIAVLFIFASAVVAKEKNSNVDDTNKIADMTFVEICNKFNYPVETHTITTQDGYILTYFRIQRSNTTIVSGLPVIYLQHGLVDSSFDFIINEEHKAPGLLLANQGFDVWLGNSRGNDQSLGHVSLNW